jgi:hypothetical protein
MIKKKILPSAVQSITLDWDFQDEAVNSTERQKDRQKSARNLVIIEIDPSVPRVSSPIPNGTTGIAQPSINVTATTSRD